MSLQCSRALELRDQQFCSSRALVVAALSAVCGGVVARIPGVAAVEKTSAAFRAVEARAIAVRVAVAPVGVARVAVALCEHAHRGGARRDRLLGGGKRKGDDRNSLACLNASHDSARSESDLERYYARHHVAHRPASWCRTRIQTSSPCLGSSVLKSQTRRSRSHQEESPSIFDAEEKARVRCFFFGRVLVGCSWYGFWRCAAQGPGCWLPKGRRAEAKGKRRLQSEYVRPAAAVSSYHMPFASQAAAVRSYHSRSPTHHWRPTALPAGCWATADYQRGNRGPCSWGDTAYPLCRARATC